MAILAGFVAFFAFANAFGSSGAGVTGAGLAVGARGCAACGVVDLAVAVVVEVVAAFVGFGFDLACASSPCAACAGFCSVFASADAAGICGAGVAGAGLAVGARAASFVDLAVAVVVEVVVASFLGGGADITCASPPCTSSAGFGSLAASADALGSGGAGITGTGVAVVAGRAAFGIFVDLAVAVVVYTVAQFGGGLDLSFAPSPLTARTGALAAFADADVGGSLRAFVAGLFFAFDAVCFEAAILDALFP